MNLNEDSEATTDNKKSGTMHGRRATSTARSPGRSPEEATAAPHKPSDVPLRARKTGGWADEGGKSASKGKTSNIIEQERFQREKSPESGDDIPVIPDIDDLIQTDALDLTDVKVPNVTVKESTYKELDSHFENFQSGQFNFGNLGDLDLSILTNRLHAEKDVQKCTDVWTMESMFQDFSKNEIFE